MDSLQGGGDVGVIEIRENRLIPQLPLHLFYAASEYSAGMRGSSCLPPLRWRNVVGSTHQSTCRHWRYRKTAERKAAAGRAPDTGSVVAGTNRVYGRHGHARADFAGRVTKPSAPERVLRLYW